MAAYFLLTLCVPRDVGKISRKELNSYCVRFGLGVSVRKDMFAWAR